MSVITVHDDSLKATPGRSKKNALSLTMMEETAGCARRAKTQAMYGSSAAAYRSGTRRVRWGRPSGEGGREIAGGSGGCSFVGGCPSNPAGILGSPKSDVGSVVAGAVGPLVSASECVSGLRFMS